MFFYLLGPTPRCLRVARSALKGSRIVFHFGNGAVDERLFHLMRGTMSEQRSRAPFPRSAGPLIGLVEEFEEKRRARMPITKPMRSPMSTLLRFMFETVESGSWAIRGF